MQTFAVTLALIASIIASAEAQAVVPVKHARRDYIGSISYPVVNPETGKTNAIALRIPKPQGNDVLKRECGVISDVSLPSGITYRYLEIKRKTNSDYYIIALHDGDAKRLYDLLKHSKDFAQKSRLLVR